MRNVLYRLGMAQPAKMLQTLDFPPFLSIYLFFFTGKQAERFFLGSRLHGG